MVYNEFKRALAAYEIDLLNDDVYLKLIMTNSTAPAENDTITTLADFTTIDEFDGSGYADALLASVTVTRDDDVDAAIFDAANPSWLGLGAGSRDILGWLFYHNTSQIPICYIYCRNAFAGGNLSIGLPEYGIARFG